MWHSILVIHCCSVDCKNLYRLHMVLMYLFNCLLCPYKHLELIHQIHPGINPDLERKDTSPLIFGRTKMLYFLLTCIVQYCIVIICNKLWTPVVNVPNVHSNQQMKQVAGGSGGNTLEMLRYSWIGNKWDEPFNICFKRCKTQEEVACLANLCFGKGKMD